MYNILVKLFGLIMIVLEGDPALFDRWIWLRRKLKSGNLRTLDAGCGTGSFILLAAKKGNNAIGISFDRTNNEVAGKRAKILGIKNVKFITVDLRQIDEIYNHLGAFDQIICFETIEHIIDDKKLIRDLSLMLKTDGRLLLTAPYKYHKPLPGHYIAGREDGGHVRWGYTFEEMEELLSDFGLEIKEKKYISGFITQKLIYLMRVIGNINPHLSWILVLPLRVFSVFDYLITKKIKYPFLSIGIVAVKKV
jgi:SAM-dependent methyltransferase